MTEAIRLVNPHSYAKAEELLAKTPANGKWVVEVRMAKAKRSLAQNSLMWRWHSEYSKWRNNHVCDMDDPSTKDLEHDRFKWKFVAPIISRRDPEYSRLVELAKARGMARKVSQLTSSTDLTVEEMTEALNEYDNVAQSRGCCFSHPEDLYYQAMGK